MSDRVDIKAILARLTPQHRDDLRKLAADPRNLEAVMRQVRADIAERECVRNAEIQQIEEAAAVRKIVTAFCAKISEFTDTLAKLNSTLDRIELADEARSLSAAIHKGFRPNSIPGHLHFDKLAAAHEAGLAGRTS